MIKRGQKRKAQEDIKPRRKRRKEALFFSFFRSFEEKKIQREIGGIKAADKDLREKEEKKLLK